MHDFRALSCIPAEAHPFGLRKGAGRFGSPPAVRQNLRGNRAVSATKSALKPPYRVSLTSANGFNANHPRSRPPPGLNFSAKRLICVKVGMQHGARGQPSMLEFKQ